MLSIAELRREIKKITLLNAVNHKGKAQQEPVIGKLLAEMSHLRAKAKEIMPLVAEVVEEVNNLNVEEQREIIEKNWPEALVRAKAAEEERGLPPLPNMDRYDRIVTRFSPNPDAPVHLGSARAIILCHEYAKIYRGKIFVRFEDTDPKLKKPRLQFYESIKEDLRWLECEPNQYFTQSDRLPIYYKYAKRLLREGYAYVCTCKPNAFKKLTSSKKPCGCRILPPREHIMRWQRMLDGTYREGQAVVRIKTDLTHPNPAVRDWPALRIVDTKTNPHPRVGSEYRVWPLYNLACGIDDHLMGITHIIRGKEHLTNQVRQEFMYRYLGWTYPDAIHYGRMKITGASLSKSKMIKEMSAGIYKEWDDPRLATFAALRRRGIQAEAIRRLIIEIGPKTQDVTLSWKNLYAHNRRIIEPKANRYFFVHNPRLMSVERAPEQLEIRIPLHPDDPQRGFRQINVQSEDGVTRLWVSSEDVDKMMKGQLIRLMELYNVEIANVEKSEVKVKFHSQRYKEARKVRAPLIHWIPEKPKIEAKIVLPDASIARGLAEESCKQLREGDVVQFERYGFARIDRRKGDSIVAYYCHR